MQQLTFQVLGTPAPQGSKTCFCRNGKATLVDASKSLKAWRKEITTQARLANGDTPPIDVGVSVRLHFRLARPATVTRDQPTVKPDLDKLIRAVLDGITDAGVWADDARVLRITAVKTYTTPELAGVQVQVTPDE